MQRLNVGMTVQQQPFHPQQAIAYPMMANIRPSSRTQGVFSSYPVRLKHSNDNALLLPETYIATKKLRFSTGDESEDETMEEADEQNVRFKHTATNQQSMNPGAVPINNDWAQTIRRKNEDLVYSTIEMDNISNIDETLVPIRLDLDIDSVKLRDRFLWNMNEQYITPERFGEMLCEDLQLTPMHRFVQPIADSIRSQVVEFETFNKVKLPLDYTRVVIHLDLQVGKVNYRDQFEWELDNNDERTNAPEIFSRQLTSELGVGGEYVSIISHAIREQIFKLKKQYAEEVMIEGEIREILDNGFRFIEEASEWQPHLDALSNNELEKLLVSQERNIRRMRRETRFRRSFRRQ
ncbi:MAG: hypothetical protein EXX96DRAFT_249878 [Benjaminiella poitrasii]|nr:MAG: hypothetical protein EXX96DRAFT_249878 [Benjaminiella poitrasii]